MLQMYVIIFTVAYGEQNLKFTASDYRFDIFQTFLD